METGDLQSLNKTSNQKFKNYCEELKRERCINLNILFINLPQILFNKFEPEVAKNRGYYAYQPTGLQCLISSLGERKIAINLLDLNYELLKKIQLHKDFHYNDWLLILKDYLEKNKPSIICISNFFKVDEPYFIKVCEFLRNMDNQVIIIAGGQNATYNSKLFLEKGYVDFICERESENKLRYLIDSLYGFPNSSETEGILFKFNNKITKTEGNKDIVELKGNLIETHKKIPVEDYCNVGSLSPFSRMAGKNTPFCGILLNRGCIGNCKFCDVVDFMGKGVRSRKTKDFLDEMEYLYENKGIRHFEILDDDFAQYKKTVLEVLKGICEKGFKITWAANNGIIACTLDREIMAAMKDSGCIGFKIGVESGNPETLKIMGKPGTLETFLRFSKMAQEFPEIFISDYYIMGFPQETMEKIMETFLFSIKMNLDWASYAVYQQNVNYAKKEDKDKVRSGSIGDFLPGKDILKESENSKTILTGIDIFRIKKEEIPSKEQLSEIWFTFNFIRNFILNKNLFEKGNLEKFIKWVSVLEDRYPTHPYINFALSLANWLLGDVRKAKIQEEKMRKNLEKEGWRDKLNKLGLSEVLDNFPNSSKEARKALDLLKEDYIKCMS